MSEKIHQHFAGSLTARDCKRHIPHTFVMPAHCGQVEIHFHFAPYHVQNINNLLSLTVFDPNGFRGEGHRGGDTHPVHISASRATPGYLPGALPAGVWTVQIDTHMIMPGEPVHYGLDIEITEGEISEPAAQPLQKIDFRPSQGRGAGWYRGDLHAHTHHSDATRRTVSDLVQAAGEVGLDFIFLTDHNTISGLGEIAALSSPELLTAGGIELTTYWGHALCLGTHEWVDWRIRPDTGEMGRIAAAAYARGEVFIIAHPQSLGDPGCTGCAWRYGEMMPGNAKLVEIWNGPWDASSRNEEALMLWYDWLNQGLRLAATAGTDTHSTKDYSFNPGFNVIYAEELSEGALLKALRAGHLYLSSGPQIGFQAEGENGTQWMMGDTVAQAVKLTASWAKCPENSRVRLIANGRLLKELTAEVQGEYVWNMEPKDADWVVMEVRGGYGQLLAISNPVYFSVL